MSLPPHFEIARRAYVLWETRGQPIGQDHEIWMEAEEQVKAELKQPCPAPDLISAKKVRTRKPSTRPTNRTA